MAWEDPETLFYVNMIQNIVTKSLVLSSIIQDSLQKFSTYSNFNDLALYEIFLSGRFASVEIPNVKNNHRFKELKNLKRPELFFETFKMVNDPSFFI